MVLISIIKNSFVPLLGNCEPDQEGQGIDRTWGHMIPQNPRRNYQRRPRSETPRIDKTTEDQLCMNDDRNRKNSNAVSNVLYDRGTREGLEYLVRLLGEPEDFAYLAENTRFYSAICP